LKLTASQGCFDASSADGRFLEENEKEDENQLCEKCISECLDAVIQTG